MASHRIALKDGADLADFRRAVGVLIGQGVSPDSVAWSIGEAPSLFGADLTGDAPPVALPRAVGELIEIVVCHRDPERYGLLYTLVWRLLHGERALLDIQSDP